MHSGIISWCSRLLKKIPDLLLIQQVSKLTRYRQGQTAQKLHPIFTDEENVIKSLEYLDSLGPSDHIVITFDVTVDQWQRRKLEAPKRDYRITDFECMMKELKKGRLPTQDEEVTYKRHGTSFSLQ